jgi:hypothetical protein
MLENKFLLEEVPSSGNGRENGKHLDYELGRPHLEKRENRFSIEEVPSSRNLRKNGKRLGTELGRLRSRS